MADIVFTDTLAVNPGLEDVLDPNGVRDAVSDTTFRIVNDTGGTWDGFVFEFTGTGFTYNVDEPTAGTITGVTVYQADGTTVVATITGTFGTTSLAAAWSNLENNGVLHALGNMLVTSNSYTGGTGADHLTQFGIGVWDTMAGGGGDDTIVAERYSATLVGDGGSDTFVLGSGYSNLHFTIAGSAQDGSGGGGEVNTLVAKGWKSYLDAVTDIDVLEFVAGTDSRLVYVSPDQIGAGLLSDTLSVEGSTGTYNDLIYIEESGASAVTLDLSGWTFTNWTRTSQYVSIRTKDGVFDDDVTGSSGRDIIYTYDGDDILRGGAGNDTLTGGDGADILRGGAGDDTLSADADDTVIDGGADTDRLYLDLSSMTQAIVVDPTLGTGVLADTTVVFTGIEGLATFTAGSGDDVINAGFGQGTIYGGDGDDIIDGGGDRDYLYGGAGNDQLFSRLGEGQSSTSSTSADNLDGGDDIDFAFVDRSDKNRSMTLDLADPSIGTGLGDGTYIVNIEQIEFRSGSGNDSLTGGGLDDIILGNGGRDLISGRGGDDTLTGGAGLDIIDGGDGQDTIDGGDGIDFLSGDAGNDTLEGGEGADLLDGGSGNDTLNGGANGDNLGGGSGNDELNGDGGADIIDGGVGNDTIDGGKGRDTIDGEGGKDIINGGAGRDALSGGGGRDIFVFSSKLQKSNRDEIDDFSVKYDTIHLDKSVFTKVKKGALKANAFEQGSKADDAKDRIIYDKATGNLFYDADGNKSGKQVKFAELDDGLKITAADFFVI